MNAIKSNKSDQPAQLAVRAKAFLCLGLSLFGLSAAAEADTRALSQVGTERGLELYDTDAADQCILGHHQVRVTVTNLTGVGILKLELFGEKNFMRSSGKLRRIRVPAEDGEMTVCIHVPEPGDYAVVGYHDVDADRKLDKAWNFRPKEPFGLSNNPKIESLRLPRWEETRFRVPESGVDIRIEMVDPD